MKKIIFLVAMLAVIIGFACPAYAAPKVFESVNNQTSIPIAGMDVNRNPVTLRLDPTTGALLTESASGASEVSILADGTVVSSLSPLPVAASVSITSPDNTTFRDDGTATKVVVKASAGELISATCYNASAGLKFFQIFDTASTPVAGSVPKLSFLCTKSAQIYLGTDIFSEGGLTMANGIGMAISTTYATFTDAATANEQFMQAVYK